MIISCEFKEIFSRIHKMVHFVVKNCLIKDNLIIFAIQFILENIPEMIHVIISRVKTERFNEKCLFVVAMLIIYFFELEFLQ